MTLSLDLLHRLLSERGTVSAYDGARALMCRPEEFAALAAEDWWGVLQHAGPGGWLYSLRPTISARAAKTLDAPKEWAGRTVKPGSYA